VAYRGRPLRGVLSPDSLWRLYQDHTDLEIAELHGVTETAVALYRKKAGIRTIPKREREDRVRRAEGLPVLEDLTPVELSGFYQQMGDRQIARMFGVTKPTILNLRRQWGIASINKAERATSDAPLSEEQRQIILGTLLGDGHLLKRGALKIGHSHAQAGYLRHVHRLLAPISKPIKFREKVMDSGTVAYEFTLLTRTHRWLKYARQVFYPEGKRVFPEEVLTRLAPRSLAFWYFDDGHLDSNLPSFALGDISLVEAEAVVSWVGQRFALDTYLKPQSTETCKLMGIRARTTDIFFALIQPFVIPDLLYKLPRKFWPTDAVPSRPRLSKVPSPIPKDLQARSRAWNTLDAGGQDRLLGDWLAFWALEGFPYHEPRPEDLEVLHHLEGDQVIRGDLIKRINVGQGTCQSMVPRIWDIKSRKAAKSPLGLFEDPASLRGILKMILKRGVVPNAARIRSGVRLYHYSGAYNFRPVAAKVLVDRFCPPGGTVYDPCGGWGGRLLGTILSTALPKYIACEPQPETFAGLERLQAWVSTYLPEMRGKVTLHNTPAEDFVPPMDIDVVLTSPPYWRKMIYGAESNLAGNRYPTYTDWVGGFLRGLMSRAVRSLRLGGWLILNVDDVWIGKEHFPLVADTLRLAEDLGLGAPAETFKYDMQKPGQPDNHEPVLCWSKGPGAMVGALAPSLGLPSCSGCGRHVPAGVGLCSFCQRTQRDSQVCEECREEFHPRRKTARFCSDTCGARSRRQRKRETSPPKETRTFTCRSCGAPWETAAKGNFHLCPTCRETKELQGRTKVCAYRRCGQGFIDTSIKNGMRFCCPKHREGEKRLRMKEG